MQQEYAAELKQREDADSASQIQITEHLCYGWDTPINGRANFAKSKSYILNITYCPWNFYQMLKDTDILDYFLYLKNDKNLGTNDQNILEFIVRSKKS